MSVKVIYAQEDLIPSFHQALTSVAQERIFIESLEAPPLEKVIGFQKSLIESNGACYYAIDGNKVVGWCDIFPYSNPRMSHRGALGMGILKEYRGKGLGFQLVQAVLEHAKKTNLEKVELYVYTTNKPAIKLYRKCGFIEEGLIKNYRKLDGQYFDCLSMAKLL